MNFESIIEEAETAVVNFVTTSEADVQKIIVDLKTGISVAETELNTVAKWVAANAPQIAADIQSVVSIATAVGVTANPEVAAAITAANVAVTALNTFAAAENSGQSNAQSVIAGYVAVKQASAAASSAAAAAVSAK